MVCTWAGLVVDGYSFAYVATWAGRKDGPAMVRRVGATIQKTAAVIIDRLAAGGSPAHGLMRFLAGNHADSARPGLGRARLLPHGNPSRGALTCSTRSHWSAG